MKITDMKVTNKMSSVYNFAQAVVYIHHITDEFV